SQAQLPAGSRVEREYQEKTAKGFMRVWHEQRRLCRLTRVPRGAGLPRQDRIETVFPRRFCDNSVIRLDPKGCLLLHDNKRKTVIITV
ncbi:MAG TPA: hypothetical protein PLS22_09080, partial [Aquabacterium sp.]|nr:hypothetical protein [Aquabacterium sp.]